MIDFIRTGISKLVIHHAGNAGLGQPSHFSENLIDLDTLPEETKHALFNYLLGNFKSDGKYYQFRDRDIRIGSVKDALETYQTTPYVKELLPDDVASMQTEAMGFLAASIVICKKLERETMHPKLSEGYFYMVEFTDVIVDGALIERAYGIYKAINENIFLQLEQDDSGVFVAHNSGFSLDKIEYGALIAADNVLLFEKHGKSAETTLHWTFDFLNVEPRPVSYFQTARIINNIQQISDIIFNDVGDQVKQNQLNRSAINYLNERERFIEDEFVDAMTEELKLSDEIAEQLEEKIIEMRKHVEETEKIAIQDFEISMAALKERKKIAVSKIKLDKNFEITVKGDANKIDYCIDPKTEQKYLRLDYFTIKSK